MSEQEPLQMTISDTITLSRELREEGQIDGQVKLYNVEDEGEFESEAELFFDRTLMTNGLRETLTILRDSLKGDDPRGTHILYGPYGSGKSHQMVALYHCFNSPEVAGSWAKGEIDGFTEVLPGSAIPITVAMQNEQYEHLWEPFFEALDYDPGSYESGGYPDMKTIQEAVGDRTVAFFVDELEDWFATLSGNRRKANQGFLQALLETTALSDVELHTVVSVLREESAVHNILNREQAVEVNMNNQVDKREILHHRLIESVDETAAREIVNDYVDTYEQSTHVDVPTGLRSQMHDLYPFHPILLDALETRYYADEGNQNTRGMIYLFSKVLLGVWETTDLITHGDVDALEYEDEMARINYERLNAASGDIQNRVDADETPYGRRILNTILLYSLKPSEGEGADITEIVMGAYRTGDRISDIVLNLERLHGVAWHLHKLNGKYAIRDRQNPNALIRNAATDVSEKSAKAEIADILQDRVFGKEAYPVGFRTDDIRDIPDSRDIKVIIKDSEWTHEEVQRVITNDGRGREWRNTFVFVQPSGEKAITSGTRYIDKARYIEGARQVLADESLEEEIRDPIQDMKAQEENELREELELLYGEVLDGNDFLNDFDPTPMELDVFVVDGDEHSATNIAEAATADPFDLREHISPIVKDLLDRRGEVSIEEIYEQFLRNPELPVPGGENDVLNKTVEVLEDKPVLARDNGLREELDGSSLNTVLVHRDSVERWTEEDVEQELRQRFGSGETAIDIGNFELNLLERSDVWLDGDSHDIVMTAIGRLVQQDSYIALRGNEVLDKPQSDATLRDVSEAEVIGSAHLSERIESNIDTDGKANVERIIGEVRTDESVFLPPEETVSAAREAVNGFLVDDYVLEAGGRYLNSLEDRDPTTVTLVPTVGDRIEQKIDDYVDSLEPGDKFTVKSIADRFDSSVTEDSVETYLLQNLGRENPPEYVVGPTGSENVSDWVPGYPFRVPDDEGWKFKYKGADVAKMRKKWRSEHEAGDVLRGDVAFTLPKKLGVPGMLQGSADVAKSHIDLTLEAGQDYTKVQDLLERMPDEADSLNIEITFE